jgi:hypothetical protein
MANVRGRIVFGLLLISLGAMQFVTASAYVVDHDFLRIAAIAVGAFAFPIAPVTWHLIGERRRKTRLAAVKMPPKQTLTAKDRYWLRFAGVAFAVLGPMFAASGLGVVGAVWRHGLWFVPASSPDRGTFQADERLLRRVPGDAELVAVVPGHVFAWGNHQDMLAGAHNLDDVPAFKRIPVPLATMAEVPTADHSIVSASDGWRAKVEPEGAGPSDELRAELARAPKDAAIVVAFAPRTPLGPKDVDFAMIRHAVVWEIAAADGFHVAVRFEATDAATATKLADVLSALLRTAATRVPESCHDEVQKLADRVHVARDGAVITAEAELPKDAMIGLGFCGMK